MTIPINSVLPFARIRATLFSRYFNNPDYLTLENQQIISDALDKLNYQENKVARILANGKTEFVAICIISFQYLV